MSKTIRERAIRMVMDHETEHQSRWVAVFINPSQDRLLGSHITRMGEEDRCRLRQLIAKSSASLAFR